MLFNSYVFWLFFSGVVLLHRFLPHRGRNRLLLLASYIFYSYWDPRFLLLILMSTVVDFSAALGITRNEDRRRRRSWLLLSILVNLGLLAVFKYLGFFTAEFGQLLTMIGMPALIPTVDIVLPVGISPLSEDILAIRYLV